MNVLDALVDLYPYVAGFYVLDSIVWVRRGQHAFTSNWDSGFQLKGPGLYLVGLSPLAEVIVVDEAGVRFGVDGFYTPGAAHDQDQNLTFTPYTDVHGITVTGKTLELDRRPLIELRSTTQARRLATVVQVLSQTDRSRRADAMEATLRQDADLGVLRARRKTQERFLNSIGALGVILLFGVFGPAVPLHLVYPSMTPVIWTATAGLLLVYIAILFLCGLTLHHSGVRGAALLSTLAPLVLFPPSAIHAKSVIFRNVYRSYDLLAIAGLLLKGRTLALLAGRWLRQIRSSALESAGTDLVEFWHVRERLLMCVLSEAGLRPDDLFVAPAPDSSAVAYCPLCLTQYRVEAAQCIDCNMSLESFSRTSRESVAAGGVPTSKAK